MHDHLLVKKSYYYLKFPLPNKILKILLTLKQKMDNKKILIIVWLALAAVVAYLGLTVLGIPK